MTEGQTSIFLKNHFVLKRKWVNSSVRIRLISCNILTKYVRASIFMFMVNWLVLLIKKLKNILVILISFAWNRVVDGITWCCNIRRWYPQGFIFFDNYSVIDAIENVIDLKRFLFSNTWIIETR